MTLQTSPVNLQHHNSSLAKNLIQTLALGTAIAVGTGSMPATAQACGTPKPDNQPAVTQVQNEQKPAQTETGHICPLKVLGAVALGVGAAGQAYLLYKDSQQSDEDDSLNSDQKDTSKEI